MTWFHDFGATTAAFLALAGGALYSLRRAREHWQIETGTPLGDVQQAVAAALWLFAAIGCLSALFPIVHFFVGEVLW